MKHAFPHLAPLLRPCRLACLTLAVALAGCAGYQFGADSLYRSDVRTVAVPIFQSDSYRRYLGERLTEAVIREIQLNTPYQVVSEGHADSVLVGRIITDHKVPLVENQFDEPRDLEFGMVVDVSWQNYRGDLLRSPVGVPLPTNLVRITQTSDFIPEAGQSISVSEQEAIERIAQQIVGQMELGW